MPKTRAYRIVREPRAAPEHLTRRPTCAITRDHNHELLTLPKSHCSAAEWAEHYAIAQRWHDDLARKGVPHRLETEADGRRIKQIFLHRLIGPMRNGQQRTHWCCDGEEGPPTHAARKPLAFSLGEVDAARVSLC